jgi:Ribosomal S17
LLRSQIVSTERTFVCICATTAAYHIVCVHSIHAVICTCIHLTVAAAATTVTIDECCTNQVSAIEQEKIEIDPDTKELLDALDFKDIPNLLVAPAARVA